MLLHDLMFSHRSFIVGLSADARDLQRALLGQGPPANQSGTDAGPVHSLGIWGIIDLEACNQSFGIGALINLIARTAETRPVA